jgi:hydroxymethylglutaryl-CoA reductase
VPSCSSEFHRLSPKERLDYLRKFAKLSEEDVKLLSSLGALGLKSADRMIENVIGVMPIPLGIAMGFVVNGREYLVPMATEQESIISMATRGAELTLEAGGFRASSTGSTMAGQIQLVRVPDLEGAKQRILENKGKILQEANAQSRTRKATDVEVRYVETSIGPMLIVELLVDVKDSMGANVVNSMCEAVAPLVERLGKGKANLRVVSNLAASRLVHVETIVRKEDIGGAEVIDRIIAACDFAESDPWRAATHNKGIMNGVSAVLLATSNDTRAVEAGAHAYAAITGRYRPLSTWRKTEGSDLMGELTMPMVVGIVGGAVSAHQMARMALKILGVRTAAEFGGVVASAGLAYNLAALQALVTVGIKGL